ncbi:carboxypeptidase regulatory-like domain-containing protein [Vibrio navarrensis]|nr:carboxypeptidase regulatory-like domain-containing protein [Vibrio navarrensis]
MTTFSRTVISTLIAAALSACGGGDGGSSPDPVDPVTQVRAISTQIVSGQVTSSSGQPVAKSSVAVQFQSSDGQSLVELSTESDDSGFYSITVPEIKADAHQASRLVVSVAKSGFVDNEKSIDVNAQSNRISVNVLLATAQVNTVKRSDLDSVVVSANGVPSLRFSLVKNSRGQQRVVVGEVSPAADEDVQLALNLPVANIDPNVEAINSEVAYFDSSNANDIQSFPGEFEGQGTTDNQGQGVNFDNQNSDESYRLISSTFSQIRLTDENQQSLPLTNVQPSAGESPSIVMMVPKGSYPTIQRDFDLTTDGIQIPIYVYRSGQGWQYVGNGVLVNDAAGNVVTSSTDIPIDDQGVISLTGQEALQLYVKVEISQANQWIQWINLDWPIKAGVNTNICLQGKVSYQNGEKFYGQISVRLPDGGTEWHYIEDGAYQINTLVSGTSVELTNGALWSLPVYNQKTWQTEYVQMPATLTVGGCNDLPELVLVNPYACTLEGHTFESNGSTPVANQYVRISHARGQDYAYTDANGSYSQSVLCDSPLAVSALGQNKTETVTSAQQKATLDFIKANQPPLLGALLRTPSQMKIDESADLRWSVSDPDGDAVTVNIECEGDDNCTIERSGTRATITFSSIGEKTLVISADDGQTRADGSANPVRRFPITVRDSDNIAPQIVGFDYGNTRYSAGETIKVQQGNQGIVTAIARDGNGDTLSYQWSGECSGTTAQCDLAAVEVGEHTATLTVTDDHNTPLSSSANIKFKVVADQAPVIEVLSANPSSVGSNGQNNVALITLAALVSDDFTARDQLQLSWSLVNSDEQDVTSLLGDAPGQTIRLAADTIPVGSYQATLSVTDTAATPNVSSKSVAFTVLANQPPSVALSSSATKITVLQGQMNSEAVIVTATVSDDDGDSGLTLDWTMTKDAQDMSSALALSADKRQATIAANSLSAGNYVITLKATDAVGLSSESQLTVSVVEDKAPQILSLTATPRIQQANESGSNPDAINFSVSVSDDNDDAPTVAWTFSTGVSATVNGNTASIAAESLAVGEYQASVTVTDNQGQATTQNLAFSVLEFSGNIGIIVE